MGCPLGFGELNIPSSRAFWDDCEEDELSTMPAEKLQLCFEAGQNGSPIASDMFMLIEGDGISDFATKALLQNSKLVCKIPAKKSSLHFNDNKKLLICILEEDLNYSGEIAELLTPYAQNAQQVVTVTIKSKIDYKSEEINKYRDNISIIRSINGKVKNVKELEAPNFIAGAAAGIANWRECAGLSISSYVIYTDKLPLDGVTAQPILKLLQELNIECSSSYVPLKKEKSLLYL